MKQYEMDFVRAIERMSQSLESIHGELSEVNAQLRKLNDNLEDE